MSALHVPFAGRSAVRWVFLIVALGGFSVAPTRSAAEEPVRPVMSPKLKDLLKERLTTAREMAALVKERFKNGHATVEQMADATRVLFNAELDACETQKERISVLEKFVVAAKEFEQYVTERAKVGQGTPDSALMAKSERLKAEIALERERLKEAGKGK